MANLSLTVSPGFAHRLGATPSDDGVNFAVYSRNADAVDLCLFDRADPAREIARARMIRGEAGIWTAFVHGAAPGDVYGFRAHGPWLPVNGMRFNSHKLLLDPYARSIIGDPSGRMDMLTTPDPNTPPGALDNGATALKSVVIADDFDWGGDTPPCKSWNETVIYEMHIKGLTHLHSKVPEELRGTYSGLAHPAVTSYLRDLGVTAVQLLPIHQHLDDGFLVDKGLTNYWGYSTIGFFAPHSQYAAARDPQEQVREFKRMVRDLHAAGLEVILDVVYNHTAEGNENGPTLMFRGFANTHYYRHGSNGGGLYYINVTGTGNAVASNTAPSLRLILDSLRYWVTEMHVDGFRFDLAVTVGRYADAFSSSSPFFTAVQQDPVLSRVKLIAEPWDVGWEDSYQLGQFPEPWRELNGKFRDDIRRAWRGDSHATADFAKRVCGSDELFRWNQRPPLASVNFVTSHDGFTLRDLVSYKEKHNEANGEDNRDGDNQNHSINCGTEGESRSTAVRNRRERIARGIMASLLCSQGVPMITAGDERWRTQRGNNNAYCQDSEISWMDWTDTEASRRMRDFTAKLLAFRKRHPVLSRIDYFDGRVNPDTGRRDVTWFNGQGGEMTSGEWHDPQRRIFGMLIDEPESRCLPVRANGLDHRPLLFLFNHGTRGRNFPLPGDAEARWALIFDTAVSQPFRDEAAVLRGGSNYDLEAHSMACLVLNRDGSGELPPVTPP